MSHEMWPKRKRSDLMAHMTPYYGIRKGFDKKTEIPKMNFFEHH